MVKKEGDKIKGFRKVVAAFVSSTDATEQNRNCLIKAILKMSDKYLSYYFFQLRDELRKKVRSVKLSQNHSTVDHYLRMNDPNKYTTAFT